MHWVEKCECGKIMSQCRCPGLNGEKAVRIVPCMHVSETGDLYEDADPQGIEVGS